MSNKYWAKTAMLATAAILAATVDGAAADLKREIRRHGKTLPTVIDFDDFHSAALEYGMTEIGSFLVEHNIPVVGEGDSAYLRSNDLIRACGDDCSLRGGLGELLYSFAVQHHSNR